MISKSLVYSCLFGIVLISCSATKKSVAKPGVPVNESKVVQKSEVIHSADSKTVRDTILPPPVFKIDTILKVSYGACYGDCPIYDLTLYNDGTAVWNGVKNTVRIGSYVAKVSRIQSQEFEKMINAESIWSGPESFPINKSYIADFPARRFFLKNKDHVRVILVNHSPSSELKTLEQKLLSLSDLLDWQNISNR